MVVCESCWQSLWLILCYPYVAQFFRVDMLSFIWGLNLLQCLSLAGSFGRHIQVALEKFVARQRQMRKHDQVRTCSPCLAYWMNTQIWSPLGFLHIFSNIWLSIHSSSFLLGARCLTNHFDSSPGVFSREFDGIVLDYSRQRATQCTFQKLFALAKVIISTLPLLIVSFKDP